MAHVRAPFAEPGRRRPTHLAAPVPLDGEPLCVKIMILRPWLTKQYLPKLFVNGDLGAF